jgi:ectoine hydroxylase-related dioxygenase (phytanoyl-CoA dioxygenase family)
MILSIDGYAWESVDSTTLELFSNSCQSILNSNVKSFGIRGVARQSSELGSLVINHLRPIAQKHLGPDAILVRSILFDKPLDANWAVPWHQDVTIEVQEKHEVEGFGPWSTKDGIVSVQPPSPILEQMLTLRLHLDDTDGSNGALLVDPGSHLLGKKHISDIKSAAPVTLECQAGAVLLMKPLLCHASNRSTSGKPRRILHLDFASNLLPEPLKWMPT